MNTGYLLQKVVRALVTLVLVVTFIFVVLRITGDPVSAMMPDDTDPAIIEQMREDWGLNRPLWRQYADYWAGIFRGDLGDSFLDGKPAVSKILERIPKTLQLTITSFIFMILVGTPAGMVAALNRNRWQDRAIMTAAVSGFSLPNFFLGILLILTFSVWFRLLPSAGSGDWQSLIMPVFTLGTAGAGVIARFDPASSDRRRRSGCDRDSIALP